MFGMGWSEMLVVGIVALIVVGPKDLPKMFRAMGEFTGKARGMAREFSRAMESAADDAGVKDIAKTIRAAGNPAAFGADKLKSATGLTSPFKSGGATEALSKERQETKDKIAEATARAATERKAREAAGAASVVTGPETVTAPDAAAKPEAKAKAATKAPSKAAAKPKPAASTAAEAKPKPARKPRAPKPAASAAKGATE